MRIFRKLAQLLDVDLSSTPPSDGDALTYDSGAEKWVPGAGGGGGGAPTDADYLVGTSNGDLSAEIVVGTSPGGELGGTWASPTVDATHSGSSHASVQAAAEATASAALSTHSSDTTGVHGIADTSALVLTGDSRLTDARTPAGSAGGVLGGTYPNPSFASDMATQAELDAHLNDTSAAHAASAVSADSTTLVGTGTDVQAVLEELDNGIADHIADSSAAHAASAISASSTTLSGTGTDVQAVLEELDNLLDDHSSRHENGGADEISIAGLDGTPTELTNHLNDTSAAHAASAISFSPTGNLAATDAQAAIAEAATDAASALTTHEADTTSVHGITDTSTLYRAGGTDVALADGGTGASLSDPNADRIMFWDDSAGAVTWLTPGTGLAITTTTIDATGSGLFNAIAHLADQQTANTNGGTFTQAAWQTRVLNTEVYDASGIVSLSSNQFTLQAGTYLIKARAPAFDVNVHKAKIRNVTDSTDAIIGSSCWADTTGNGSQDAIVQGIITIAAQKTFELQHQCSVTKATSGFGAASNLGVIEVYAEVWIYRM